jgi:hypothetical protein
MLWWASDIILSWSLNLQYQRITHLMLFNRFILLALDVTPADARPCNHDVDTVNVKHFITFFKPSRSYKKDLICLQSHYFLLSTLFPALAHLSQLSCDCHGFPYHVRVLCLPMLLTSLSFLLASLSFTFISLCHLPVSKSLV